MKKTICLGLALLSILAQGSPLLALDSFSAVGQPNGAFNVPISKNGVADAERAWSLPSICRVRLSTTPVVCESAAAGFITGIEVDSGVAAGVAVALDTIVAAGASATAPAAAQLLTIQQTCPAASTAGAPCGERHWRDDGRPFFAGLVLAASAADMYVTVTYRKLRQ